MCGRYAVYHGRVVFEATFGDTRIDMGRVAEWLGHPHYNIRPTQRVPVVVDRDGVWSALPMRWGIIPKGTDPARLTGAGGARRLPAMINARDDRMDEAWPYALLYRSHRCLIPASGFYEWERSPDGKTRVPRFIRLRSDLPFVFAGLWDVWTDADGNRVPSCSIVTTAPNEMLARVHDRMPVILPADAQREWLGNGDLGIGAVRELCLPYDPAEMEMYPVSKAVDGRDADGPELINPLPDSA